ncbi:MAG: hypothetical protein ACXQTL_00025 [Methanosarcinales archaeon]
MKISNMKTEKEFLRKVHNDISLPYFESSKEYAQLIETELGNIEVKAGDPDDLDSYYIDYFSEWTTVKEFPWMSEKENLELKDKILQERTEKLREYRGYTHHLCLTMFNLLNAMNRETRDEIISELPESQQKTVMRVLRDCKYP